MSTLRPIILFYQIILNTLQHPEFIIPNIKYFYIIYAIIYYQTMPSIHINNHNSKTPDLSFSFDALTKQYVTDLVRETWKLDPEQYHLTYFDLDDDEITAEIDQDFEVAKFTMGETSDKQLVFILNLKENNTLINISESINQKTMEGKQTQVWNYEEVPQQERIMQKNSFDPFKAQIKIVDSFVNEEAGILENNQETQVTKKEALLLKQQQQADQKKNKQDQELKMKQAEAEEKKKKQAEAEAEEKKKKQAEVEEKKKKQAEAEEKKKKEAEVEEKKKKQAEVEEKKKKEAEVEEKKKKEAEAEEKKKKQAEAEEKKKKEAEVEEKKKKQAKAEEKKKKEAEGEKKKKNQAEEKNKKEEEEKKKKQKEQKKKKQTEQKKKKQQAEEKKKRIEAKQDKPPKVQQISIQQEYLRKLVRQEVLNMIPEIKQKLVSEQKSQPQMFSENVKSCQMCNCGLSLPFYYNPALEKYVCRQCEQKEFQSPFFVKIRNLEAFHEIAFMNLLIVKHEQLKNPNKESLQHLTTLQEASKVSIHKAQQVFMTKITSQKKRMQEEALKKKQELQKQKQEQQKKKQEQQKKKKEEQKKVEEQLKIPELV